MAYKWCDSLPTESEALSRDKGFPEIGSLLSTSSGVRGRSERSREDEGPAISSISSTIHAFAISRHYWQYSVSTCQGLVLEVSWHCAESLFWNEGFVVSRTTMIIGVL